MQIGGVLEIYLGDLLLINMEDKLSMKSMEPKMTITTEQVPNLKHVQ